MRGSSRSRSSGATSGSSSQARSAAAAAAALAAATPAAASTLTPSATTTAPSSGTPATPLTTGTPSLGNLTNLQQILSGIQVPDSALGIDSGAQGGQPEKPSGNLAIT